ncbi:MAG: hypothetical protein PUC00_07765 [Clostridiales bacterium]|nr:hypothetical protein [Clostridiales bacterium]
MNLIAIGMLINSACVVINRFVRRIPERIAIPSYLVGIVLIILGFIRVRHGG